MRKDRKPNRSKVFEERGYTPKGLAGPEDVPKSVYSRPAQPPPSGAAQATTDDDTAAEITTPGGD